MGEWKPIETAPENKEILVYRDIAGGAHGVDKFDWNLRSEERLVSERGNRRTYETVVWKEQDWYTGWGWTHWQPLPLAPSASDAGAEPK